MESALISLTFDDGLRCQFEQAVPILRRYDFVATFFLVANQDATHDSWWRRKNDWWKIDWREVDIAMLKQLIRDGHEIGSHSVTHDPNKMQIQPDIEAGEAGESKRLIEGWVGTGGSCEAAGFRCGGDCHFQRRRASFPAAILALTR
jgi:peptidoglycan/xylan/chitin deacetylase (PgdA/CDA1 family)